MDLENIKRLVEHMLVQVQYRRIGQPMDVYDIIGNLEKIKTYFLTEAMQAATMSAGSSSFHPIPPLHPTIFTTPTPTVSDYLLSQPVTPTPTTPMATTSEQIPLPGQPVIPQPNPSMGTINQQIPLSLTPPVQTTGQQALVSSGLVTPPPVEQGAVIPMDVEQPATTYMLNQPPTTLIPQPGATHISNQQPTALIPQPGRPFARNPTLWQPADESLFVTVSPPALWFSKEIEKRRQLKRLPITSKDMTKFIAQSPTMSFVHSGLFSGMALPATLRSSKIDSLFRGIPGLLVHEGGSTGYIYWPAVSKYFELPVTVNVLLQWKSFRDRYMLILYIDEDVSGPSETGPGPSGTGPGTSGTERGPSRTGPGTSGTEQGPSRTGPGTSGTGPGTSGAGLPGVVQSGTGLPGVGSSGTGPFGQNEADAFGTGLSDL